MAWNWLNQGLGSRERACNLLSEQDLSCLPAPALPGPGSPPRHAHPLSSVLMFPRSAHVGLDVL